MHVKVSAPQCGEAEAEAARAVLLSGNYVSGATVAAFERAFADYIGTAQAVAVSSGTAALHAALAAEGIGPGDEVIVPALTFFSTVTAVIHQGGVPVFADISPETFSLDPADLARALSPRTKAIIPVHYFGHAARIDAILAFARTHRLAVIEDCAQSHGTSIDGRMTGSFGQHGCFSMFATKHMTTGGEGGMVTTNDPDKAAVMRKFRAHGMEGRDDHVLLGYNYRMTELEAAIGLVQLGRLEALNEARIARSDAVIAAVRDIPWLTVPVVPPGVRHTYFWCHVLVDEERLGMPTADLVRTLAERGVETRNRYKAPLYRQPLLTMRPPPILALSAGANLPNYGGLHLPNAERLAGKVIGLPNRPDMTDDEIAYVAEVLHAL